MKKFFVWSLIVMTLLIGTFCCISYLNVGGMQWYHLFLLAGAQILFIPALQWWRDFFYGLFDLKQ